MKKISMVLTAGLLALGLMGAAAADHCGSDCCKQAGVKSGWFTGAGTKKGSSQCASQAGDCCSKKMAEAAKSCCQDRSQDCCCKETAAACSCQEKAMACGCAPQASAHQCSGKQCCKQ